MGAGHEDFLLFREELVLGGGGLGLDFSRLFVGAMSFLLSIVVLMPLLMAIFLTMFIVFVFLLFMLAISTVLSDLFLSGWFSILFVTIH